MASFDQIGALMMAGPIAFALAKAIDKQLANAVSTD
jgi:hypothetical protein